MTKKKAPLSSESREAIACAIYEYLLIVLPVLLYLLMESLHRDDWFALWRSPEWSIATLFLAFQAGSLYARKMTKTGRKLSFDTMSLLALGIVVIISVATLNTWLSLVHPSAWVTGFRVFLFTLVTMVFIILVGSGRAAELRSTRHA